MKILTVAEFDPAGVHIRHRKWLRGLGVDYRLAVRDTYRPEGKAADYILDGSSSEELSEFARAADLVQVLVAISQPRSVTHGGVLDDDPESARLGGIDWRELLRGKKRIALFHGSRNAADMAERYAAEYRSRGMLIAATTLGYVSRMAAEYLPPVVDLPNYEPAPLRKHGDALNVIQCPTDPFAASTNEIADVCRLAGVQFTKVTGKPLDWTIRAKAGKNCGVDHLRGDFSVNSLENAALRLVNLVGTSPGTRAELDRLQIETPWPQIDNLDDLSDWVRRLRDDLQLTRDLQSSGRDWAMTTWHPETVAKRLLETYERIAAE